MSNSPYISLNEAAELTGRAKSTISKALKNGKMSYVSQDPDTKQYQIDPAEALRAFPKKQETGNGDRKETPKNTIGNSALQVKLEVMEQRFADAEKTIEDLRGRLDAESAERRALTAMLTDQRQSATESPKRGFWARLMG